MLHDTGCQGKLSLFMLLIGFTRKKTTFRAERPYVELILKVTAGNMYCWLEKHGGKANITLESTGEGITKYYGLNNLDTCDINKHSL